jgi:tRNA 5-methylaminomethyl-2-thiouridine biosynthesis bifunctional protein
VLRWTENFTPISQAFDDIYYAKENGLEETRFVFLGFNRLPEKFSKAQNFHIAELGFGTGLNFLATYELWQKSAPQDAILLYSSFEKFPLSPKEIRTALKPWPELEPYVESLLQEYEELPDGVHRLELEKGRVFLDLWIGDARELLPEFSGPVDAWYFDGFAPQKNPELWGQEIFREVARASKLSTSFSTYASTGFVRRHLVANGFHVEKTRGYGRKREMCFGEFKMNSPVDKPNISKELQVIGGGISGLSQAFRHSRHRGTGRLVEKAASWISMASGNPLALVMPTVTARPSSLSTFSLSAFLFATRQYRQLERDYGFLGWHPCGMLQLLTSPEKEERFLVALGSHRIPKSIAQVLSKQEASEFAGIRLSHPALLWSSAGFLEPHLLVSTLTGEIRKQMELRLSETPTDSALTSIHCSGHAAALQLSQLSVPWKIQRGQISYWDPTPETSPLRAALLYGGYLLPSHQGFQLAGSTYDYSDETDLRESDHLKITAMAQEQLGLRSTPKILGGRAALRVGPRDALPLLGVVNDQHYHLAHGSKAYSHALLAAEILASEFSALPAPIGVRLRQSLHPQRFAPKK